MIIKTFLVFLIALNLTYAGHIFSQDAQIEYYQDGNVSSVKLHFALESGLKINNFIEVFIPITGIILTNVIKAQIYPYEQFENYQTTSYNYDSSLFYFELAEQNLEKNTWYTLEIFLTDQIYLAESYSLVEMRTVSISGNQDRIIYDQNRACSQLYIYDISKNGAASSQLQLSGSTSAQAYNSQSKISFTIQPEDIQNLDILQGVVFVIDSSNPDFSYYQQCDVTDGDSKLGKNYFCRQSQKYINRMHLYYPYSTQITSNFVVNLYVNFPGYFTESDLTVNIYAYDSKLNPTHNIIQHDKIVDFFKTNELTINVDNYQVLFGYNNKDKQKEIAGENFKYPIVRSTASDQYNTLKFPFKLSTGFYQTYTNQNLILKLSVKCVNDNTQIKVVPLSINHNLGNKKQIQCKYDSVAAVIQCTGIQYISSDITYWIAAKIAYTGGTESFATFGNLDIFLQEDTGLQIFKINQQTNENLLVNSTSSVDDTWFKHLGNTQVVSVQENSNVEEFDINEQYKKVYSDQSTGIGIFPEREGFQSLLFFLKLDLSVFNEAFTGKLRMLMTLDYNPNIINFENDDFQDGRGLYVSGKVTGAGQGFGGSACGAKPRCKNYGDADSDINLLNENFSSGFYQFSCQDDTAKCLEQFDGFYPTTLNEPILAMRRVKFNSGFTQNSILADDNSLDFLLQFYIQDLDAPSISLKTTSLINAYTVSIFKPQNIVSSFEINFVNFRYNAIYTVEEFNEYADSYVRLSGQKSKLESFDKIGVFFDTGVHLADFEEEDKYVCNINCSAYKSETIVESQTNVNYLLNSAIVFENSDLNENFDILYAIKDDDLTDNINFMHIVLFDNEMNIIYSFVPNTSQSPFYTACSSRNFGPVQFYGDTIDINTVIAGVNKSPCQQNLLGGVGCVSGTFEYKLNYNSALNTFEFNKDAAAIPATNTFESCGKVHGNKSSGIIIVSKDIDIFGDQLFYLTDDLLIKQECIKISRNVSQKYSLFCPTEYFPDLTDDSTYLQLKIPNKNNIIGTLNTSYLLRYGISTYFGVSAYFQQESIDITPGFSSTKCYQYSIGNQQKARYLQIPADIMEMIPMQSQTGNLVPKGYERIYFDFQESPNTIQFEAFRNKLIDSEKCEVGNFPEGKFECSVIDQGTNGLEVIITALTQEIIQVRKVLIEIQIGDELFDDATLNGNINFDVQFTIATQKQVNPADALVYGQVRHDDAFTDTKYSKQCEQFTISKDTIQQSPDLSPIPTIDLQFPNLQQAPSDINININFQLWGSNSITFYQTDSLQITWNFLKELTNIPTRTEVYCQPYVNGEISFDFSTFTQTQLINPAILTPKKNIENVSTIQIKCLGAKTPSTIGTGQELEVNWIYGSKSVTPASKSVSNISYLQTIQNADSFSFTMTKKQDSYGQNVWYDFVIPLQESISPSTAFFVQFASGHSPKLNNKEGSVTCFLASRWAHCEQFGERSLKIYSNISITVEAGETGSILLSIQGITQPNQSSRINTDKRISIGISISGDIDTTIGSEKGLDYIGTLLDSIVPSPIVKESIFSVLSGTISADSYRSVTAHEIVIAIDKTISIEKNLIIEFYTLRNAFSRTPLCFLYDITSDLEEDTNLIDGNCELFQTKSRLQINLKESMVTDHETGADTKRYKIKLENLGYPNYENYEEYPTQKNLNYLDNQYKINFINENNKITSSGLNYSGKARVSYPEITPDSSDLYWSDTETIQSNENQGTYDKTVGIGHMSTSYYLFPQNNLPYQSSITMAVDSNTAQNIQSKFQFQPSYLRAYLNDNYIKLQLGAKAQTDYGPYIINFVKSGGSGYSKTVPDLYVIASKVVCQNIYPEKTKYYVIQGQGQSWPINLIFQNCQPLSSLKVTASISGTTAEVLNPTQTIDFQENQQTIKIPFAVKSNQVGSGILQFTISDSSGEFYGTVQSPTIEIVKEDKIEKTLKTPLLSIQKQESAIPYTVKATIDCQISDSAVLSYRLYYAYHIKQNEEQESKYTRNYIKEIASLDFQRDPYDPFWSIATLGYQSGSSIQKDLLQLKDGSDYIIYAFCENQLGDLSAIKSVDFTTSESSQFLLKVHINVDDKMNLSQQRFMACSLTYVLKTQRVQVVTNQFVYCDNYEAGLAEQLIQQESNSQNNNDDGEAQVNARIRNLSNYEQIQENGSQICNIQQKLKLYNKKQEYRDYRKNKMIRQLQASTDIYQEEYDEAAADLENENGNQEDSIYSYSFYVISTHDYYSTLDTNNILSVLYDPYIIDSIETNNSKKIPNIINYEVTQPSSSTAPVLSSLQTYVNYKTLTVSITVENDGYIYMGLDYHSKSTPANHSQLLKGLNGDSKAFQFYRRESIQKNVQKVILFEPLSDAIDYNLYIIISSDQPNNDAKFDPKVYQIPFKIDQKWFIPDIHDPKLIFSSVTLLILLIFTMTLLL